MARGGVAGRAGPGRDVTSGALCIVGIPGLREWFQFTGFSGAGRRARARDARAGSEEAWAGGQECGADRRERPTGLGPLTVQPPGKCRAGLGAAGCRSAPSGPRAPYCRRARGDAWRPRSSGGYPRASGCRESAKALPGQRAGPGGFVRKANPETNFFRRRTPAPAGALCGEGANRVPHFFPGGRSRDGAGPRAPRPGGRDRPVRPGPELLCSEFTCSCPAGPRVLSRAQ